jgi:hypothetical protein
LPITTIVSVFPVETVFLVLVADFADHSDFACTGGRIVQTKPAGFQG